MSIQRQVNEFRDIDERTALERDAARYRWLKDKLKFRCGYYETNDTGDVTESHWLAATTSVFVAAGKEQPTGIDAAIDAAMNQ